MKNCLLFTGLCWAKLAAVAGVLALALNSFGQDDPTQLDRERRARAATAVGVAKAKATATDRERRVSAAVEKAVATTAVSKCKGKCEGDLKAVQKESVNKGKPIILFVGGTCDGRSCELGDKVLPVSVPSYDGDGVKPADTKRIWVMAPGGMPNSGEDKDKIYFLDKLAADATSETITERASKYLPKSAGLVDWSFLNK